MCIRDRIMAATSNWFGPTTVGTAPSFVASSVKQLFAVSQSGDMAVNGVTNVNFRAAGAGVAGAGVTGAGVAGAGVTGAGVTGAGVAGAAVGGAGVAGAGVTGAGVAALE